jgi:Ca-activated chloride channel homolog
MRNLFFFILRYIFASKSIPSLAKAMENTQDEQRRYEIFYIPLALSACVASCQASLLKGSIHFGAPQNMWCFLLLGVIAAFLSLRYHKRRKAQELLVGTHFEFLRNHSARKQIIKSILFCIGFLFLCVALLRPQWDKSEETVMQEGRDLYIALDISRSMLATDCQPNRLQYAKEKIKRLIKKLSSERIGLILFSGSAFVQCPLTTDYSAFYLYLDAVDAELISSGSTALDQAVRQALTSFASVADRKNKLLVLFTDGEDFSSDLHGIKQEALNANLSIFTIGIGTPEGAPVPLFDQNGAIIGHQKDAKGGVVISRLSEHTLYSLCQDAGGQYIRATDTDDDIAAFVRAVEFFDKEQLSEQKISRYEDQYHYFLLISFVCFVLEWLL